MNRALKLATPTATIVANDALVRRHVALRDILGIANSTAWRLESEAMNDPNCLYPKPHKIGTRVYYKRSDIDRWIAIGLQIAARDSASQRKLLADKQAADARKAEQAAAVLKSAHKSTKGGKTTRKSKQAKA
jgi:predicted DNA-binding transcriptional regulator AlpA